LRRPYEVLAQRVASRNRRSAPNEVRANAEPSPATLARLREHYEADAEQLDALLGMTPPWRTSGTGPVQGTLAPLAEEPPK
jgi:hypothetical protein